MNPARNEGEQAKAATQLRVPTDPGGTGARGEPTTLLSVRQARPDGPRHVTSAEQRERDALVRAGFWGVGLSTLAVLLISALMGLMRA